MRFFNAGNIRNLAACTVLSTGLACPLRAQDTVALLQGEAVMNWAEYAYPQLFAPSAQPTQVLQGYRARYYPQTRNYLGVRDGVIYAAGAAFAQFPDIGGGIRRIGPLESFLASMEADGFAVPGGAKLVVSEAMASDPNGGPDWFELYSAGTEAVALAHYGVKDGNDERALSALPDLVLAPGEYLVITASEEGIANGNYAVPFNLGGNDRVQLYRDGVLEDDLDWGSGEAPARSSYGRYPGPLSGGSTLQPTPGARNDVQRVHSAQLTSFGAVGTLASAAIHTISVAFDQAEFTAMIATYNATEEKLWMSASISIDGKEYGDVGLRLKGNSSLRGVSAADDPATIPWLVKLDKFAKSQNHFGLEEFVIRSNNSRTALNEAVALELLELAGLASQDAIATLFSVNDGAQVLRLVIEHPDGLWMAEEFSSSGALYKAESTGDYSYRGDDPAAYDEVFDQEAGDANADLTPLIAFLKFINEADEGTFNAELPVHLDIDAFAVYLAMQDLLANSDDIDGPGNNAYLYYDTTTAQFTVVPWDYNLAFGQLGGIGGTGGGAIPGGALGTTPDTGAIPGGGQAPLPGTGVVRPDGSFPDPGGIAGAGGNGQGGFGGGDDILVQRFLANASWNALYVQKTATLTAELYTSGAAQEILAAWQGVVTNSKLIDAATIAAEALAISQYFNQ